jgi:hypothetical protein
MTDQREYGASADGWPLPKQPRDYPPMRKACADCVHDTDCTGGCLATSFEFPAGPVVVFLAAMAGFAVIGALTVFSWFL